MTARTILATVISALFVFVVWCVLDYVQVRHPGGQLSFGDVLLPLAALTLALNVFVLRERPGFAILTAPLGFLLGFLLIQVGVFTFHVWIGGRL